MAFCLIKEYSDKFLIALRNGEISPEKMVEMTSAQRKEFLSNYVGVDNAREVNALFESKLLLKNQQKAIVSWAKKVGGLTNLRSTKTLTDKVMEMKDVFGLNDDKFLNDLVNKRLGIDISEEEGKIIGEHAAKLDELWKKAEEKIPGEVKSKNQVKEVLRQDFPEYFRTQQEMEKFIREQIPGKLYTSAGEKVYGYPLEALQISRQLITGPDVSFLTRQGQAMIGTKEWRDAAKNLGRYLKSESAVDGLEAEMMINKYADILLANRKDLGLTLLATNTRQRDEMFVNDLVKNFPVWSQFGRANEAFINELRFRRYVNMLELAEKEGVDIMDKAFQKDLAEVIGAATGRGSLGGLEKTAGGLGGLMFSPRWMASRIRLVSNVITKKGFARKEAAKSLSRSLSLTAGFLTLASLAGANVDLNTTSSDFGKIKIGNTRIDPTGGMAQYIVLLSRGLQGKTTSSITGKTTDLNSGTYGDPTYLSVVGNFFRNKTTPLVGAILDGFEGKTFEGVPLRTDWSDWSELGIEEKKAIGGYVLDKLILPMAAGEAIQTWKSDGWEKALLSLAGEFIGTSTSTYGYTPKSKEWEALKVKDEDKYEEKLKKLNDILPEKLEKLQESKKYQKADMKEQNKMIDDLIKKEREKLVRPKKK